jgi:hydroxypyruvate isomerase
MLWPELEAHERVAAAASAGFEHVEMRFPQELDVRRLETELARFRMDMVLFDPAAGDWAGGERGLLALPGREAELVASIEAALALARRFGTRLLNTLVGIPTSGVDRRVAGETAVQNLRTAADLAAADGATILVESLNNVDVPGYWAGTVADAAWLVHQADRENVRLQLDQYHVAMSGDDPLAALREHLPIVGHVQIADVPGRHEPGSGRQAIRAFLAEIDRAGYAGFVGLEYRPLADTTAGLSWMTSIHKTPM